MADLREARVMLSSVNKLLIAAWDQSIVSPDRSRELIEEAQKACTEMEWELTLTEAYWRTTRVG